jgi:hypothetical protein
MRIPRMRSYGLIPKVDDHDRGTQESLEGESYGNRSVVLGCIVKASSKPYLIRARYSRGDTFDETNHADWRERKVDGGKETTVVDSPTV